LLNGRDIILFGDDWGRHPSTILHLGRVFAQSNRILWVNTLGSRSPRPTLSDVKRIRQKAWGLLKPRSEAADFPNVTVVQPIVLPYWDSMPARNLNNVLLSSFIRRATKRLGFSRPILLTVTPLIADVIGRLGEYSSHYICTDDYPKFDDVFSAFVEMERITLEKVDSVFGTSHALVESRHPKKRPARFLPQGVDTHHFAPREGGTAEELRMIARPIVGFFGLIASWIDANLIVQCARQYPHATFVLIGKSMIDPNVFSGLPNLKLLGEKPYEILPRYAQAFDVGLIPFVRNELTLASNPLKMLEYLAMGMAVVSTDLPEVRRFDDVVHVAESKDAFVELVGVALRTNSEIKQGERRRRAEAFSWTSVAEGVSTAIEEAETDKIINV
jgi:glycosyltransferase involved in cell wall biosynthesis